MTFKLIKAGVAAVALLAMPFAAVAADMRTPVYKGVPRSVISYYNWTGFYVGGTVGYGCGHVGLGLCAIARLATVDSPAEGHALWRDARLQLAGRLVRLRHRGRLQLLQRQGQRAPAPRSSTCETSNTWLATFRGRVGYAFDRFLPYVTGGGAYGDIKATSRTGAGVAVPTSESNFGWTFGAGLEYAFLGNWTAKLEYLYVDLGKFVRFARRHRRRQLPGAHRPRRPELQVLRPDLSTASDREALRRRSGSENDQSPGRSPGAFFMCRSAAPRAAVAGRPQRRE